MQGTNFFGIVYFFSKGARAKKPLCLRLSARPPACRPRLFVFSLSCLSIAARARVCRAISTMGAVSLRNSEMFWRGETGCEKFRNMVEVIEATNATLGVRVSLRCVYASHTACRYRRGAKILDRPWHWNHYS